MSLRQQEYRAVLGDENAECPPLCDVYASVKGDPTDLLFNGDHYDSSAPALVRLALRRPKAQPEGGCEWTSSEVELERLAEGWRGTSGAKLRLYATDRRNVRVASELLGFPSVTAALAVKVPVANPTPDTVVVVDALCAQTGRKIGTRTCRISEVDDLVAEGGQVL